MSQAMPQSHYDCPCMEKCPLHHAMQLIGGKWKVQILCAVANAGASDTTLCGASWTASPTRCWPRPCGSWSTTGW